MRCLAGFRSPCPRWALPTDACSPCKASVGSRSVYVFVLRVVAGHGEPCAAMLASTPLERLQCSLSGLMLAGLLAQEP